MSRLSAAPNGKAGHGDHDIGIVSVVSSRTRCFLFYVCEAEALDARTASTDGRGRATCGTARADVPEVRLGAFAVFGKGRRETSVPRPTTTSQASLYSERRGGLASLRGPPSTPASPPRILPQAPISRESRTVRDVSSTPPRSNWLWLQAR